MGGVGAQGRGWGVSGRRHSGFETSPTHKQKNDQGPSKNRWPRARKTKKREGVGNLPHTCCGERTVQEPCRGPHTSQPPWSCAKLNAAHGCAVVWTGARVARAETRPGRCAPPNDPHRTDKATRQLWENEKKPPLNSLPSTHRSASSASLAPYTRDSRAIQK
jgi:hypothetical protein